jgi:hypothetical protein
MTAGSDLFLHDSSGVVAGLTRSFERIAMSRTAVNGTEYLSLRCRSGLKSRYIMTNAGAGMLKALRKHATPACSVNTALEKRMRDNTPRCRGLSSRLS